MASKVLACVLAAALALASGCGKDDKGSKAEKTDKAGGAQTPGGAVTVTDKELGDAQRKAAQYLEGRGVSLESMQPGPEWKPDPENPDEPKLSPMQAKFYRLVDGLTVRQVEQVMGGKAADSGEVTPGGAKWMAWNEGTRRFLVQIMNGRCVLRCSYDPKADDARSAKFQQVTVGMSKDQVRKLLGTSGSWMGSGLADVRGGTAVYGGSDNTYMIFFVDDKVQKVLK